MDQICGLPFTARRLATQLDVLIQALEVSKPPQEIHELCREGRLALGMPPLCSVEMNKAYTYVHPLDQISSAPSRCLTLSSQGRYRETCSLVCSQLCRSRPWQSCSSAS